MWRGEGNLCVGILPLILFEGFITITRFQIGDNEPREMKTDLFRIRRIRQAHNSDHLKKPSASENFPSTCPVSAIFNFPKEPIPRSLVGVPSRVVRPSEK